MTFDKLIALLKVIFDFLKKLFGFVKDLVPEESTDK